MIEFFIAVFGILGLLIFRPYKVSPMKLGYSPETQEVREQDAILGAGVAVNSEEEKILLNSIDEKSKTEWLDEDLLFVFGEDFRQAKLDVAPIKCSPIHIWERRLLLSRLGKVRECDFSDGFEIGTIDTSKWTLRMCQMIEKNLRASGLNFTLLLEPELFAKLSGVPYKIPFGRMRFSHQIPIKERNDPKIRLW